jgi:hypothetical protein
MGASMALSSLRGYRRAPWARFSLKIKVRRRAQQNQKEAKTDVTRVRAKLDTTISLRR